MTTPKGTAGTKGVPRARREQQIVAAATEEFGRHGYSAASLAAIAGRVGVTKTLLHQYFGAKQDLYLACLTPVGDQLLDAMRIAMTQGRGTTPHTPLLVLRSIFTALEGRREAWFVLYDTSLPLDSGPARAAERYRTAIDQLAATGTAELLRAAGSTDPLDADALKYAWRGLVTALVRWWINHPDQTPDAMAERCARLFALTGRAFD
ncbi:TetR family transcriptional regulator [Streptomyces sp. SLBN-118]|uniref:TetR/AcrR family transcriptional regulator n=1 Tax=Streptomyces sp. SLBN-118 TaxID=2768454 RepID=UPI00114E0F0E|nr:TetR/AcrR family transcriptional regulator [Streptomyces sp. SLBN-118]TQK50063.1 TetR family transcriptional regulator [Streptomyces sp. SLBN-118]